MCDIVVKKFTFAISSPDEFLFLLLTFYFFSVGDAYSPKSLNGCQPNLDCWTHNYTPMTAI